MTAQKQQKKPTPITARHLKETASARPMFEPYQPLPGVVPNTARGNAALAMDMSPYELMNSMDLNVDYSGFSGFPALATLAQQVEYNNMAQVMAEEVVRNWIDIRSTVADDPRIELMNKALEKYDVKRLMHEVVRHDSIFGIAHIFVDVGGDSENLENPLVLDKRAIGKDSLNYFKVADPTWIYPAMYNTQFPLKKDFYKPSAWFVMGQLVHESRFIDVISRPVPDILKPSYNFAGLSLIQMMQSYVDDWREAKRNVIGIMKTLRMRALATDMDSRLAVPGDFDNRLRLFVQNQENFGMWVIDKDNEEIVHSQTSLSDLSNLLSNYQEQLCIPARITSLKLLGNAPAGLNASGDSELETWHETISGYQDAVLRRPLETIFKIIQLSELGDIDENIYFEFKPLDELSDEEVANINKTKVETITTAVTGMIVSPEEGREALSKIENLGFEDLSDDYEVDEQDDEEEDI